jgi:hypothetical protein
MPILANPYPVYQPAMRIIIAMTCASPMAVTTSFDHQYLTGAIVRFHIPLGFGMEQANQLTGTITVTGATTFTIDIDSTFFTPFSVPVVWPKDQQYAQVVPIGEDNNILTAATENVLPY